MPLQVDLGVLVGYLFSWLPSLSVSPPMDQGGRGPPG